MGLRRVLGVGAVVSAPVLGLGLLSPAVASAASSGTLYVSPGGADGAACGAAAQPCKTIDQAIANAAAGDTVHVGPGSYHEQVVVSKQLIIAGYAATVDASGLSSGSGQTMNASAVLVPPPGSGSTVEGLVVHGATGEGILVQGASHVTVEGNTVAGNDLGTPATTSYLECQAQGQVPGDCGEGLHLMSATDSTVYDNVVIGNSGGILVTDELGPASGNTIDTNLVEDNLYDCGITLPSHNPNALSSSGVRQPAKGGVFDNVVKNNMIFGNGIKGEGAGVLFAAAGPGMASYDNTVTGNIINGNDLAGVTIHSHTPNQDVSGNVIKNNTIGQNNVAGDPDAQDMVTTGIVVSSAVVPVTVTISGNHIYDNQKAIFTTPNVTVN